MHLPAGRVPDVRGDGARHRVPYGGAAGKHFFPLCSVLFVALTEGAGQAWQLIRLLAVADHHRTQQPAWQCPDTPIQSVPDVAPLQGFDPELVLPQLEMYTREK